MIPKIFGTQKVGNCLIYPIESLEDADSTSDLFIYFLLLSI